MTRRVRLALAVLLATTPVVAQVPGAVPGVGFDDPDTLSWSAEPSALTYNVYRGSVGGLRVGDPPRCRAYDLAATSWGATDVPAPGEAWAFVVTGLAADGAEGTPGDETGPVERALLGRCEPVLRAHLLDRTGFGWSEWARDRVELLGFDGYVQEQLDPMLIDESTNAELNAAIAAYDPPIDIIGVIARQVVTSLHARRQLEQQVTTFWTNHFNTYWSKIADIYQGVFPQCPGVPQCDPNFPAVAYLEATTAQFDESERFRDLAFNGTFREILEVSATSPAMILFLDSFANVAGAPNENYSRELLELYAMGVDGGYTQSDVEELARVLTGWTICKKKLAGADNPLTPCIENYWEADPPGRWAAHFDSTQHDCTAKTLFAGTPEEVTIADTCAVPTTGAAELDQALDAIVAHPATPRFISGKLAQRFITDTPDTALIDDLVAVWNDPSNPQGVGDLRAVLEAVLTHPTFLDPSRVRSKVKTPVEQLISAMRAVRGETDGVSFVINFLVNAQHIPYFNPVPTGWAEDGGSWIDTTNTLERQNMGVYLTAFDTADFGSQPITLLNDNGVSTAPGNAAAIVDFMIDALFGGALDPSERQAAIDFLETDIDGTPSPYDDTRIRRTVGFMLGYPQFQEQ